MKEEYEKKQVKSLRVALKDLESVVRDTRYLWSGREFTDFALRPRETWANWILAAVLQYIHGVDFTFSESDDGDGYIIAKGKAFFLTEHVSAMNWGGKDTLPKGEDRILWAFNKKNEKGREYASGKTLVIFTDGVGEWFPNKVSRRIPENNFDNIYCIGFTGSENQYSYSVSELVSRGGTCATYQIIISDDFKDYSILKKQ